MLRVSRLARPRGPDVDLHTFKKLILHNAFNHAAKSDKRQDFVLVDVRRDDEVAALGTAPGSIHIPLHELPDALHAAVDWSKSRQQQGGGGVNETSADDNDDAEVLAKIGGPGEKNIIFFCRSGNRTLAAMQMADALGYQCCHVPGGFTEYLQDPLGDDEILKFVAEKKAQSEDSEKK